MLQIYIYSLCYAMIVWFLYDLYTVITDQTLMQSDKILYSIVDIFSILFITCNFINPRVLGWTYFLAGFLLIGWYVRQIPIDITDTTTTTFQKVLYSSIDYIMLLCMLIGSMSFTALEKIAIKHGFIDLSDTFKLVYNLF